MEISAFTDDPTVAEIVARVKSGGRRPVSNIVDDAGNQYVDLVMEGGGMLGIALVGYVYVLEQANIRFLGVAGTSAGAIAALLLAATGRPGEAKSHQLLAALADKNFYDFVDGGKRARAVIDSWVAGNGHLTLSLVFHALFVIGDIRKRLGLNPGEAFLTWLETLLIQEGVSDLRGLKEKLSHWPVGLRDLGAGETIDPAKEQIFRLAVVASEVATQTKVELPKMAALFWPNAEQVNPARFVRASMSIPYFFYPMRITPLPDSEENARIWRQDLGFTPPREGKQVPPEAVFIDGGMMSNFPIDIFHHKDRVPRAPTFGIKLNLDHEYQKITTPVDLFWSIFASARHVFDDEFIRRHPDYQHLVGWIDVKEFNWLNFNISDEDKIALFRRGAQAAEQFLRTFEWREYRQLRASVAQETLISRQLTVQPR